MNLLAVISRYKREFGFTIPDRLILIDDIRVRGIGKSNMESSSQVDIADGPPAVETVCVKVRNETCWNKTTWGKERKTSGSGA